MALWNDSKDSIPPAAPQPARGTVADLNSRPADKPADTQVTAAPRAAAKVEARESVIAAGLTIEGKIQGAGNVRLSGRFKGDVQVEGNVTIESGAHVEGSVQAHSVVIGGELTGNIDKAKHVDVLQTGVVVGDVKADTIAVAAGSRMRGQVEFGWTDGVPTRGAARSN